MRSDQPGFVFAMLDPSHFESLDRYRPGPEYLDVVRRQVGTGGWSFHPGGFWTQCVPDGHVFRVQGWKIHLSAVPATAQTVLERVVPVLSSAGAAFKFCSDRNMLSLCVSKNWPREGAGKFVTVYPKDEEQFLALAEECHQATADLRGPYILSDRPYRDSRVVYYRYGEHTGAPFVDPSGATVRAMLAPDGERVRDDRRAYFHLPAWVRDPFGARPVRSVRESGEVVLNGRYKVASAMRYSSVGGLYLATDLETGEQVVVREARPMLSQRDDSTDGLALLEKEARILRKMQDTGLCPRFVDLFRQWEHLFLVQEKLEAESLWGYAIGFYFGEERKPTSAETLEQLRDTIRKLVRGLQAFHARGIVLRDMTKTNVLFTAERTPRFIDFELAFELDREDPPVSGFTPGYASRDQLTNQRPTPVDDHYALGALILDIIAFTASGLPLNRSGILAALRMELDDLGLPFELYDAVAGLLEPEASARWTPERALAVVERARVPARTPPPPVSATGMPPRPAPDARLVGEVEGTLAGLVEYLRHAADFARTDRLWPASPLVFSSNPVSLGCGAAGTAAFLLRATGAVPPVVLDWICQRTREAKCPPGLYSGLSGVALVLLEAGRAEEAERLLAAADGSELRWEVPGLYLGTAGWGLAHLAFWERTGSPAHLQRAREAGERLLERAEEDERGLRWTLRGSVTPLGYSEGGSGVATFLASLYAGSGEARFLDAAMRAMDFEISEAKLTSEEVLWYPTTNASPGAPKSPHMAHGSTGVGTGALRVWAASGETRYLDWARRCARAASMRMTNKTWFDYGLAGWGEYLLDMHRFLGEEIYFNTAFYMAEALLPHRIDTGKGIAMAGQDLLRISCDFQMGSAGIGIFLHRLINPATPRAFLCDGLLLNARAADAPEPGLDVAA